MVRTLGFSLFKIETKKLFRSIMLVVNPLIWYYAVIIFLQNELSQMTSKGLLSSTDSFLIWGIHFSGIIFAALLGALLTKKIEKNRFLLIWMALGAASSITLFAVGAQLVPVMGLVVLLLGISLGLGMPACMGYYTNSIPVDKRGRVSGLVLLITGIGIFAFTLFPSSDPLILGCVLAGWRLTSFVVLYFFKSRISELAQEKEVSYRKVLSQQSFILYLLPWIMFSFVNYLAGPVQVKIVGAETAALMTVVQTVVTSIFAVIGGFLLDSIGRKRVAISGFVMLGIDAAMLGLFPQNILSNYFSAIVDGIAWGFLLVIFIVTIWGDLSQGVNSSKYYAIGVLPFFASKFLEVTVGTEISTSILNIAGANGLFSFLAFFLFVAVLPLVYAPETLPEKVMKDKDLRSYVDKALKKVQQDSRKVVKIEPNNSKKVEEEKDLQDRKNEKEYEEAQALAEKYY